MEANLPMVINIYGAVKRYIISFKYKNVWSRFCIADVYQSNEMDLGSMNMYDIKLFFKLCPTDGCHGFETCLYGLPDVIRW